MGRANGGGGFNTAGNQGGGDKLQGLVSTTNRPVVFSSYVRTRADGGDSRNWVFCTNQLGGVGRRWGQAAGPGNRGGVHAVCKAHAHRSRQRHPGRPKQSSGWGNPPVHRANALVVRDPPTPQPPHPSGFILQLQDTEEEVMSAFEVAYAAIGHPDKAKEYAQQLAQALGILDSSTSLFPLTFSESIAVSTGAPGSTVPGWDCQWSNLQSPGELYATLEGLDNFAGLPKPMSQYVLIATGGTGVGPEGDGTRLEIKSNTPVSDIQDIETCCDGCCSPCLSWVLYDDPASGSGKTTCLPVGLFSLSAVY